MIKIIFYFQMNMAGYREVTLSVKAPAKWFIESTGQEFKKNLYPGHCS